MVWTSTHKRELREVVLLVLLGAAMTIAFGYTKSSRQFLIVGSFTAMMWVLLWKGNQYLSYFISRDIDWLNSPIRSLLTLSLASIVYTGGIVLVLMRTYEWAAGVDFGDSKDMVYSSMITTIIISLFMHGRSFLIKWKETAIDAEKLKRESVTARYESLKNQVNPHFLFNSLNALTNLVYQDQDKSVKFIKQLSEVYRYVLETRDKEVVPVEEELRFLNSYLFLQQIRFENKLKIENSLTSPHGFLPPLALQMLIENAIKHNVISDEHPLTVELFKEGDNIIVRNNLRKKHSISGDSSGVGLENIRKRYEFVSGKKVVVVEDQNHFVVKLPLLRESV